MPSAEEALAEYSEMDDSYPALCSEDCMVEPDGLCPHGDHLTEETMERKFPLGQVVSTPGALDALFRAGQDAWQFIGRHVVGDWGELDEQDRRENELSGRA